VSVHPGTPTLLEWLEERRDEMVRFLEELVRTESPTTDADAQAHVFDLVGWSLEEVGYRVRALSGEETGGQLFARPGAPEPGRPFQVVLGHVDTVWPHGTLKRMPVEVEDGRMRGPGVFDMKGGLAQMVFAFRALDALDLEPAVTPVVFLNSDEEIGSPESANRIRHLARRGERALVLEPALEPVGKIKTSRRGVGRFEVRVVGKGAHTGLAPEEGASAIQELSHVIQAFHALTDAERGISVNVGQIQGGQRPNVVAPEARGVVDVRVRTEADGRWVEERVAAMEPKTPGTRLEITGEVGRPPMEPTPRNRALWRAAREVGEALELELEEGMSGGASDGNITSQHTATLDGLGAVGDGAHAAHEYVEVERMPERAALLAGLLLYPSLSDRTGVEGADGGAGARTAEPASADASEGGST